MFSYLLTNFLNANHTDNINTHGKSIRIKADTICCWCYALDEHMPEMSRLSCTRKPIKFPCRDCNSVLFMGIESVVETKWFQRFLSKNLAVAGNVKGFIVPWDKLPCNIRQHRYVSHQLALRNDCQPRAHWRVVVRHYNNKETVLMSPLYNTILMIYSKEHNASVLKWH